MNAEVAPHLGGYISGEHGDNATYYPELWTWLVEGPLKVKSVLDIGCGEGHSLRYFRELGCAVRGVDGVPQDDPHIATWDFSEGKLDPFERRGSSSLDPNLLKLTYGTVEHGVDLPKYGFDLVWACEFVEHVDEQYAVNFVPCLQAVGPKGVVLMTHAFPGQLGHHHVNCRTQDYWLGFMAAAGFTFSQGVTDKARELASANEDQYNHFRRSGLAFRKA